MRAPCVLWSDDCVGIEPGFAGLGITLRIPIGKAVSDAAELGEFWCQFGRADAPGSIGWVKFKFLCVIKGRALFSAVELRSALDQAPLQSTVVSLLPMLAQGGL